MSEDIEIKIKNDDGLFWGVYVRDENKIYVLAIVSHRKGFMKQTLDNLCKKFKTNQVEFCNVISLELLDTLLRHGGKPKLVKTEFGDFALNIEIQWKIEERVNN